LFSSAFIGFFFHSLLPVLIGAFSLCVIGWEKRSTLVTPQVPHLEESHEVQQPEDSVTNPLSDPLLPERTFVKIQLDPSHAPVVIRRLKEKAKIRITVVHRGRENSSSC
jgi:hypothetical protein